MLKHHICRAEWSSVIVRATYHPDEVDALDVFRQTPLHLACRLKAPLNVIEALLKCSLKAPLIKNIKGNTALHEACHYGTIPPQIIEALVQHSPSATRISNAQGRTPLHMACRSRASLAVLKTLLLAIQAEGNNINHTHNNDDEFDVEDDSNILMQQDNIGWTPLALLVKRFDVAVFSSYCVDSSPLDTRMLLAESLLKQDKEEWAKVSLLLLATYRGDVGVNRKEAEQVEIDVVATKDHHHSDTGRRLLPWLAHACVQMMAKEGLHCLTLVALLKQILDMDPKQAQQRDAMGNLPLHHSHRATVLHVLLHVYPEGASIPNSDGRLPLHSLALSLSPQNSKGPKLSWLQLGIEALLRANYTALSTVDPVTRLFPFQLVASTGGTDVSNNTSSKEILRTTNSSVFHFDPSKKRRHGDDDVENSDEREHHPFVDESHHVETMYRLLRKDPSLVVT